MPQSVVKLKTINDVVTDPMCLCDSKLQHFWVDSKSMDVILYYGHIIEVTQDKKKPVSVLITYWKDGEIELVDGSDYKETLAEIICDYSGRFIIFIVW